MNYNRLQDEIKSAEINLNKYKEEKETEIKRMNEEIETAKDNKLELNNLRQINFETQKKYVRNTVMISGWTINSIQ